MAKTPKRPRDANQLAKMVTDIATGEIEEAARSTKRGEAGGEKGGPARAAALTPQQRSEIAHAGAVARWKKS